jgi:serine/threonine protein kinase
MSAVPAADLDALAKAICQKHDYTLREEIGSGAFKIVYRVTDAAGQSLALKIVRDGAASPRTKREVNAMKRCDHPNIARLHAVGTEDFDGRQYDFTFEEYLAGGSLSDKLTRDGFLTDEEAWNLGEVLIDALGHLDDLNLVHRDIKPDNIMFRADGKTPVLVDFGLVRDLAASSLTQDWALAGPGTPYFASPEQLNNQKPYINWRSDQFALAVTIYFSRFGAHPYQHPGEPLFASPTVQRVASHGRRADEFARRVIGTSLSCLAQMTEPWPYSRYRKPADLLAAWRSVKGA